MDEPAQQGVSFAEPYASAPSTEEHCAFGLSFMQEGEVLVHPVSVHYGEVEMWYDLPLPPEEELGLAFLAVDRVANKISDHDEEAVGDEGLFRILGDEIGLAVVVPVCVVQFVSWMKRIVQKRCGHDVLLSDKDTIKEEGCQFSIGCRETNALYSSDDCRDWTVHLFNATLLFGILTQPVLTSSATLFIRDGTLAQGFSMASTALACSFCE